MGHRPIPRLQLTSPVGKDSFTLGTTKPVRTPCPGSLPPPSRTAASKATCPMPSGQGHTVTHTFPTGDGTLNHPEPGQESNLQCWERREVPSH